MVCLLVLYEVNEVAGVQDYQPTLVIFPVSDSRDFMEVRVSARLIEPAIHICGLFALHFEVKIPQGPMLGRDDIRAIRATRELLPPSRFDAALFEEVRELAFT